MIRLIFIGIITIEVALLVDAYWILSFRRVSLEIVRSAQLAHEQFLAMRREREAEPPVAFGIPSYPSPTRPASTRGPSRATPTRLPVITEEALWAELLTYRSSHQRTTLERSESLCAYGRDRVLELEERFETLKEGDDPLDGHAGFRRDADSGLLFEKTRFAAVSENLAFLPAFTTATQVIEWGWDSSSSHRDAQLSNDWTHGCVVGTRPFYVGLFARK